MRKSITRVLPVLLSVLLGLSTLTAVMPASVQAANTAYYVDSVNGSDSNNGTSMSTPWKSLSKVNSTTFGAGDKIYLKAGSVWNSTFLYPKGSGANGNPIIIDMYGSGNKPIINCNGTNFAGVYLENQQYIEINNLEVTNDNDSTYGNNNTSFYLGIGFRINRNSNTFNHIYIKNCYIHNVDGNPGIADPTLDKSTGGIGACVVADSTANCGRFNDIQILNNKISYVSRTGIFMIASAKADNNPPYYSTNITISGNTIDHAAGDAIVNTQINGGKIDHNAATYGCDRNVEYSAGMWPWSCTDMTYEFNECAYIYNRGIGDLNAWDFDMYNRGTITYQHNYSHSNAGGMMLTMGNGAQHSIVRYNISCNEPFTTANPSSETNYDLYNNVFYKDSGVLRPNRAYNNIFLNCSNISFANVNTNLHNYNCYYGGSSVSEANGIYSNPMLVNPSEVNGIANCGGFKLQAASPCINKGTSISSNGGKDFFGNALYYGAPDIGVHEYQGSGGSGGTVTTWNDNNAGIAYTGTWASESDTNCYNGDYHSSNVLNSSFVASFTGTRAEIYGTKNDWIGMADVYVDNVKKATIDGYSATMAYQQLYYDTGVLSGGAHTVKLVVLHQKNAAAAEYYIDVDKVDITN